MNESGFRLIRRAAILAIRRAIARSARAVARAVRRPSGRGIHTPQASASLPQHVHFRRDAAHRFDGRFLINDGKYEPVALEAHLQPRALGSFRGQQRPMNDMLHLVGTDEQHDVHIVYDAVHHCPLHRSHRDRPPSPVCSARF